MNVDMLKLIQLGLTFTDAQGNLPRWGGELCVWQFNFRGFRLADDVYAQDSIELLKQSGIDFQQNEQRGIDVQRFGELLMTSGIVLNEDIRWITFHRWGQVQGPRACGDVLQQLSVLLCTLLTIWTCRLRSGYDFGYLLKILTCQPLPASEADFFELLNLYFPNIFDIKYLMKFCNNLHGGLNKLAELLEVCRRGRDGEPGPWAAPAGQQQCTESSFQPAGQGALPAVVVQQQGLHQSSSREARVNCRACG